MTARPDLPVPATPDGVPAPYGPPAATHRPLVDRVGAIIALLYFVASITVAAGANAWWVNVKEQPAFLGYVGIGLGALVLLLLPRFPRSTFVACGVLAFLLYAVGAMLGLPTVLLGLVALFGVTLWTDRRSGLWALTAALGSLGLATGLLFVRYGYFLPPLEIFLTDRVAVFLFNSAAVVVLTWAVADQVRAARERRALQRESATHAAESAAHQLAERAAVSRADALADRQRIAREMHDVVAHGLSVMIVQADGARFAAASDPDAATNALATIAATGRSSLAEMRRLLGVLRDDESAVPDAPQPGFADIETLVTRLTDSGRRVHLRFDGEPPTGAEGDAGTATGLTAYRIVQEALTNVMKHAGDEATAWVTVTIHPRRVVVEIVDDGAGRAAGALGAEGHGLRGMAERVDMLGGSLVTGPDPRGGFRVVATLPRTASDATRPIGATR
ncbi:histidine kinase [Intrasporangium oryzae NRRL B-24470]|uniref:histidine kinase n=1 Tax=Intrasporangium oryzae NRRL B-24470 TaxID=1386089 RepID=W9GGS6_9MICO|nr:histidine kinase [Intrasporangium oryzae]EWT03054.1 histidine kinase [Intrasporangium oryzae NRRL B-24470]